MPSRPRGPYRPGHHQAPQVPAHPAKPEHAKRDLYDWATLWIAAIGVFIVAVSALIQAWSAVQGQQQVAATQRQLLMMAAQQRPWIAVDLPRNPQVLLFKHKRDRGVTLFISYDLPLKNTGEAAASEVVVTSRLVGNDPNGVGDAISPAVSQLCNNPDLDPPSAIFPGETLIVETADLADVGKTEHMFHLVGGQSLITPILIGCVTYRSAVDGLIKHTPFAFEILDKDWKLSGRPSPYIMAVPYRGNAPIEFRRSRFGGSAAD